MIGRNFAFQNGLGSVDNKNSLKHYGNSFKQLALTVHGLMFGTAYYRTKEFLRLRLGGSLFSGGLLLEGGTYYWNFTVVFSFVSPPLYVSTVQWKLD